MSSDTIVSASSKPIILSLLLSGESYGYQIIQRVRHVSAGSIKWSSAMLYPVLLRMEREGLVRSEWRVSEENRMRKYYMLTEAGRRELDIERARWDDIQNALRKFKDMGADMSTPMGAAEP
jgi:PadR family transcriptional regulator, regulatory protein PadR